MPEPVIDQGLLASSCGYAYQESLAVALSTGAIPSYCYANAWHALLDLPNLFALGWLIEGWVVMESATRILVTEHAWCQTAEGTLIDPSLVLLLHKSQPVFFFPGIRRERQEVEHIECADLPLVRSAGTYGEDGLFHPDYRTAFAAACTQAEQLAQASSPFKTVVIESTGMPVDESERRRMIVQIISSNSWLKPEKEAGVWDAEAAARSSRNDDIASQT